MAATDFLTRRPRLPIWPPTHHSVYLISLPSFTVLTSKVGQSTQLLPGLQIHFRFDHDVFRITVNFTTFRTISGTFGSASSFWIVLSGHRFRSGAPGFLIESFSSRRCTSQLHVAERVAWAHHWCWISSDKCHMWTKYLHCVTSADVAWAGDPM